MYSIANPEMFFDLGNFALERERIRKAKEASEPRPWTSDPILNSYRFTNVWRADDRTTVKIHDKLKLISDWKNSVLAAVWLRMVNAPDSTDTLPLPVMDEEVFAHFVRTVKQFPPKFGSAYITFPHLPSGSRRVDALVDLIADIRDSLGSMDAQLYWSTLSLFAIQDRKWFRGLVRYEVCLDLWQLWEMAEQYCYIGSGAEWTLQELFNMRTVGEGHVESLLIELKRHFPALVHEKHGPLTLRCAEGLCCEFRKYYNLRKDVSKHRKRYYIPYGENPRHSV